VKLFVPVAVVCVVVSSGAAAWSADSPRTHGSQSNAIGLSNEAAVSLPEAVARALDKTPGTAVRAELIRRDDIPVWEVDILADRRVHHLYVDARDGSMLVRVAPTHGYAEDGSDGASKR
jgi:uncharacterized membrane protein YkoI